MDGLERRTDRLARRAATVVAAAGLPLTACVYDGPEPTCPPDGTPLTWAEDAGPFYDRYCTRCHASDLEGMARQGAPAWADFDSYAAAVTSNGPTGPGDLGSVWQQVAVLGTMPPNTWVRPTSGEVARLGEWLACGQPE